jgi:phosphate transport system substrate-binding protein
MKTAPGTGGEKSGAPWRIAVCFCAAAFLSASAPSWAEELTWVGCGISKKAFMGALAAAYEKKTGVAIKLEGGGATRGIVDVSEGKADLGGTCRHALLRQEERGIRLVPVGWDALVVLVHPSNPVGNLTLEQLKDIYTGKIANWKQVGGKDRKILVVARAGKISGVGRMFRALVFKNPEQEFTPDAKIVKESAGVEQTVENDPGAIAVSGVSSARKRAVRLVWVNGKAPVRENIADGSYLLYRPLYLVAKTGASEEVMKFLAFAQSGEGQAVIAGEGTVNLKEGSRLWSLYSRSMKDAGITPGTF